MKITKIIMIVLVILFSVNAYAYDDNLALKAKMCESLSKAANIGMIFRCKGIPKDKAKTESIIGVLAAAKDKNLSREAENIMLNILMRGIDLAYDRKYEVCEPGKFQSIVLEACYDKMLKN